jgi:hypothetical protein
MSYDTIKARLEAEIEELNAELGLTDRNRITFGYIGNGKIGPNGWDLTGCRWFVFLPHPGRYGKADDCVGGFDNGDLEGLHRTWHAFRNFAMGTRFALKGTNA